MFGKLMVERMIRSALAAMAAYVSIGIANTPISATGLKVLGVGAFSAGVSAVFTMLSQLVGDPNSTSFTKAAVTSPEAGGK